MSDKKNIIFLIIISFFIFSSRWIPSYYLFDESISVKIILDSITDGYYYFPLVKYLSIFDFNNSFAPNDMDLENIMIPFYSIFIHSFLYTLLGSFSFIFMEYFSILLFLMISFKLFERYYSKDIAILFSIIIFSIPIIFSLIPIADFFYLNIIKDNIYSLRFPRPLLTSLYLFFFLYLISTFEKEEFINKKNFFIIGLILAITISSFYYFFFIQISILILYTIYKYKFSIFKRLFNQWSSLIVLLTTFLIFSTPIILNYFHHESEYARRLGIINIDLSQKKILFDYFLSSYLKKKFLIFFMISSVYLTYINLKKIMNYKLINLFYIFFIGSAFAPLIFVLITNKTGILYHYSNAVVIFAFLLVLIIIFEIFNKFILSFINKIIIYFFSISLITLCISLNLNNSFSMSNNKTKERLEFNDVSKIILENHNLSESTLMTFDNRFMVWSVLNDIKFLNLTNFIMTPKKDEMIEDDLIKVFKFLKLDADDFNSFIANKKTSWRYINYNLNTFFFYKYIANPIKTFNNSKDFDPKVYDYIMNSSPINFEQSIIPNNELERLNRKFTLLSLQNFNYPDIIIMNKNFEFLKKEIEISNYCNVFDEDFFVLMFKKSEKTNC
tara:strand:+ start:946 stop:2784 length:1839 start_codon:yes stop_codon:yes gene_type:complete